MGHTLSSHVYTCSSPLHLEMDRDVFVPLLLELRNWTKTLVLRHKTTFLEGSKIAHIIPVLVNFIWFSPL